MSKISISACGIAGFLFLGFQGKAYAEEKPVEIRGHMATPAEADKGKPASVDYLAVCKGGAEDKAAIILESTAGELKQALLKSGLKTAAVEKRPLQNAVRLFVEWKNDEGQPIRLPAEDLLYSSSSAPAAEYIAWRFNGDDAEFSANVIALHQGDARALLQNPSSPAQPFQLRRSVLENKQLAGESARQASAELARLPKSGTGITLVFDTDNSLKRIHIFVGGRVQGVGFRAFTQMQARQLNLTGWVKNLTDGRVELMAEGPRFDLEALVKYVGRGPRSAYVEKLEKTEEPYSGEFNTFEATN